MDNHDANSIKQEIKDEVEKQVRQQGVNVEIPVDVTLTDFEKKIKDEIFALLKRVPD